MPPSANFSSRVRGLQTLIWLGSFLFLLIVPVLSTPARAGDQTAPARIIVAFQKTAGLDEIQALERRHELKMISDLPAANSRVYVLTGSKNLQETLTALSVEPIVRYAEVDQKVSIK